MKTRNGECIWVAFGRVFGFRLVAGEAVHVSGPLHVSERGSEWRSRLVLTFLHLCLSRFLSFLDPKVVAMQCRAKSCRRLIAQIFVCKAATWFRNLSFVA